jgi:REDY-like protein HapK
MARFRDTFNVRAMHLPQKIYHLTKEAIGKVPDMSTKIVALFNLKPGVSVADYENWAKTKDIPTVNGLQSVDEFAVFKSTGLLGTDDKPPYAYIETIDVNDMDKFGGEVSTETMQAIAGEFQSMADDLVFIMTDKLG